MDEAGLLKASVLVWWLPEGKESGRRLKGVKGVKYMMMEGDLTLGGEHTDDIL